MPLDPQRQLLRHLVATIAFRGGVAVADTPPGFADFKIRDDVRSPVEIVSHIADLVEGSHFLMKGQLVYLNTAPATWSETIARLDSTIRDFDGYLASDEHSEQKLENIIQGPIADALTHIGQIVMLRRAFGSPIHPESYFAAEIVPGAFDS